MPDTLIAQLYDATLDPTLWSGLATLFAQALDAPSAAISVHNTVTGEIQVYSRTSNFTDETSAVYRRNYAARDVLITRALAQSPGRTITRQEMMDDHEWSEIDIYRNFLSKLGVGLREGRVGEQCCRLGVVLRGPD